MTKAPKGWDKIEPRGRNRPVRNGWRSAPAGKKRLFVKDKERGTEKRILEIIEKWPEPTITWEALVQVVNVEFKGTWTRVALAKHPKIQKAYTLKKKELREAALQADPGKAKRKRREGDGTFEVLRRQMQDLREDNQRLRALVAKHEERYVRWKTNAYLNGWSIKKLDEKPEKPDRGQTDKDRKR
ncbi:hypothetical protein ABIG06_006547 [Bradyrhizobium sp. USDA 326]|uniref:hypothetical protein n=1 Tax=unclassified Bradyrhizobium TaxID=2631580 RepID=UPI00351501E7